MAFVGLIVACSAKQVVVDSAALERDVEAQAAKRGLVSVEASCEAGLRGKVGARVPCAVTVGDKEYTIDVTVTRVDGGAVEYQVDVAALPVSGELLASRVAQRLTEQVGRAPGAVTCPGMFVPKPGLNVTCELTDSGETYDVAVTIKTVDGADFGYAVQVASEPK